MRLIDSVNARHEEPRRGRPCRYHRQASPQRLRRIQRFEVYFAVTAYAVFSDENRHTEGRCRSLAAVSAASPR